MFSLSINAEIADTCSSVWFKPPELCKNLFTFSKKKKKTFPYTIPPPQKNFFHKTLHSIHISKMGLNHTEAFIMFTLSKFSKKNYTGQNNNITWTGSHTTWINRHLPFQFIAVSQMIWCTLKSKQVPAQRWRTTGTCFITLN